MRRRDLHCVKGKLFVSVHCKAKAKINEKMTVSSFENNENTQIQSVGNFSQFRPMVLSDP